MARPSDGPSQFARRSRLPCLLEIPSRAKGFAAWRRERRSIGVLPSTIRHRHQVTRGCSTSRCFEAGGVGLPGPTETYVGASALSVRGFQPDVRRSQTLRIVAATFRL
jgi:hypothetical protein